MRVEIISVDRSNCLARVEITLVRLHNNNNHYIEKDLVFDYI